MMSTMTSKASYFEAPVFNSGCSRARAMHLFCWKVINSTIVICVNFTRDLETEGHVMVYVTGALMAACS